jgi:hypothetical protein
MFAKYEPFKKADENDPQYRLICKGDLNSFWQEHAKDNEPRCFSNEFRHVVLVFVAYALRVQLRPIITDHQR